MPGSAPTIARRCPIRRLKRVDLPTFGRPTIAINGNAVAVERATKFDPLELADLHQIKGPGHAGGRAPVGDDSQHRADQDRSFVRRLLPGRRQIGLVVINPSGGWTAGDAGAAPLQGNRIAAADFTFKVKDKVASHIERGLQNLTVHDLLEIDRPQAELEIVELGVENFAVNQASVDPFTLELVHACWSGHVIFSSAFLGISILYLMNASQRLPAADRLLSSSSLGILQEGKHK